MIFSGCVLLEFCRDALPDSCTPRDSNYVRGSSHSMKTGLDLATTESSSPRRHCQVGGFASVVLKVLKLGWHWTDSKQHDRHYKRNRNTTLPGPAVNVGLAVPTHPVGMSGQACTARSVNLDNWTSSQLPLTINWPLMKQSACGTFHPNFPCRLNQLTSSCAKNTCHVRLTSPVVI